MRVLIHLRLLALALLFPLAQAAPTAIDPISLVSAYLQNDGIYLSAQTKLPLSKDIQDTLSKGVPLHFVAQAQLSRDRWYWYNKELGAAQRIFRISYAPLTREWRVSMQNGQASGSEGVVWSSEFNTLDSALASIGNLKAWRIADADALKADKSYTIDFAFFLDLERLPRPFFIGLDAQSQWHIRGERLIRLSP